ncbi:hypothetical protein D3C83_328170 [compost metagenome]
MSNGLNRFRGTPAQRMNDNNITPADVCEQTADGGLLRGYGNINDITLHQIHIGRAID